MLYFEIWFVVAYSLTYSWNFCKHVRLLVLGTPNRMHAWSFRQKCLYVCMPWPNFKVYSEMPKKHAWFQYKQTWWPLQQSGWELQEKHPYEGQGLEILLHNSLRNITIPRCRKSMKILETCFPLHHMCSLVGAPGYVFRHPQGDPRAKYVSVRKEMWVRDNYLRLQNFWPKNVPILFVCII